MGLGDRGGGILLKNPKLVRIDYIFGSLWLTGSNLSWLKLPRLRNSPSGLSEPKG